MFIACLFLFLCIIRKERELFFWNTGHKSSLMVGKKGEIVRGKEAMQGVFQKSPSVIASLRALRASFCQSSSRAA